MNAKEFVCNSSSPTDFKSIKNVTISNRALEINGCEEMLYNNSPTELSVTISNILEFGKILKQGFQILDYSLAIGDSQDIELWKKHGCGFLDIPQQRLKISLNHEDVSIGQNCVSLVPFPEVKFPCNKLRSLKIENNGAVKCLPEEMTRNNAQLEELSVRGCSSLAFVARTQLPSSLKHLVISECQSFQRLVDNEDDASSASSSSSSVTLKTLRISSCHKLTTLSSGIQLLVALENLVVTDFQNLESLPDGLHSLHSLKVITIWNCPSIVSFPQRGLPSTISHVTICSCEKLKALPVDVHKFNSLCDLKIRYCPRIELFPEECFPTSLTSLVIEDLKMCKAVVQWGLHRLTSLTYLNIGGCHDSDEEINGMMLPTSLTHLQTEDFIELKYLFSTGVQSLTSLEYLEISSCPKLKSFGKADLPSSLLKLEISSCPLLSKRCKRDKGKEWSKMSYIPCLKIG